MTTCERLILVCMKNRIQGNIEEKTRLERLLYPDETEPTWEEIKRIAGNPFHSWSREELIELEGYARPDGL